MTEKLLVKVEIEKQTKNTVRYKQVEPDVDMFPTLKTPYLDKEALMDAFGEYPETLEITIGVVNE